MTPLVETDSARAKTIIIVATWNAIALFVGVLSRCRGSKLSGWNISLDVLFSSSPHSPGLGLTWISLLDFYLKLLLIRGGMLFCCSKKCLPFVWLDPNSLSSVLYREPAIPSYWCTVKAPSLSDFVSSLGKKNTKIGGSAQVENSRIISFGGLAPSPETIAPSLFKDRNKKESYSIPALTRPALWYLQIEEKAKPSILSICNHSLPTIRCVSLRQWKGSSRTGLKVSFIAPYPYLCFRELDRKIGWSSFNWISSATKMLLFQIFLDLEVGVLLWQS